MQYYTNVPNFIIDEYFQKLKPSEAMILMIIVRQTYGWYDSKRRSHKKRDWISHRFFHQKTNISIRTITTVIEGLIEKRVILASDGNGVPLLDANARLHASRIYYEVIGKSVTPFNKKVPEEAKKEVKFLSDKERIEEIKALQKLHQMPNKPQ